MKIALCSDVHLEFGPISLSNDGNAEVLILSGDICVAKDLLDHDPYGLVPHTKSAQYHTFFQECCARFPHVIYIAGNHEHYHGDFAHTHNRLRERLGYLKNLHILDKESITINDVLFIGGTLWTDMNKEDPNTLYAIRGVMNDYRQIDNSAEMCSVRTYVPKDKPVGMTDEEWIKLPYDDRHVAKFIQRPSQFIPETSVADHKSMLKVIEEAVAAAPVGQKIVVVGHHAPTKASTHPRYADETLINGAYSSDLTDFILDRPQIKLWTHGHTHHVLDYMVGTTRVLCNPRGYDKYEQRADDFELLFVDV